MRLESASPNDALAMAAAHAASFAEPWSAEAIGAVLDGAGGFGLVVRDAAAVAAFAIARALAGEAELLTLAVDPAWRRRGAATALVEAVCAQAAAAGAAAIFLEVAANNTAALGLYEAAGFSPVGRRPGYYRRGAGAIDALVLRRDLNSRPA
jgi:[ribosomal protein S18]-alanine N-acetyltransferase